MSGFPILDLVVGLIFIYFLLGIICSSATELWFSMLRTRARLLEQWVKTIFDRQSLDSQGNPALNADGSPVTLGQAIIDHCMTTVLSKKGKSTSYISAENFVSALLDKITITPAASPPTSASPPVGNQTQLPPKDLPAYMEAISNSSAISGELKRTFILYANEATQTYEAIKAIPGATNVITQVKSEFDLFRDKLEDWYNMSSDRLSGKLKRTKVIPTTLILAIIVTICSNSDSIRITKYLFDHKENAKEFADKALSSLDNYKERIENIKINDTTTTRDPMTIAKLDTSLSHVKQDIDSFKDAIPDDFPMGWENDKGKTEPVNWLTRIVGWIVTILAICLGAPFWFDILNKIANLRGTGPKPSTTTTDAGK
jgi:hypothetical protein